MVPSKWRLAFALLLAACEPRTPPLAAGESDVPEPPRGVVSSPPAPKDSTDPAAPSASAPSASDDAPSPSYTGAPKLPPTPSMDAEGSPNNSAASESGTDARTRFPDAVAGIAFGLSMAEAQTLCGATEANVTTSKLGLTLECTTPPIPPPFVDGAAHLMFYRSRIVRISFDAANLESTLSSLTSKYGVAHSEEFAQSGGWRETRMKEISARGRYEWALAGGRILLMPTGPSKSPLLMYISGEADAVVGSSY
jgi:hypothetical protein